MRLILLPLLLLVVSISAQVCPDCDKMYAQGKYTEVINEIASKADSASTNDLVLLAKSYQHLDMKKDAIGAYGHILLNDENNVEALVAVGALFTEMEEYENAQYATDKALKLAPKNEKAIYNKAAILYYSGAEDTFFSYVEEQLKSNPKNTDMLQMKALKFVQSAKFSEAIKVFEQIEKTNKKAENYLFYMGYSFYKLNKLSEAKAKLEAATKIEENQKIDAFYYLAQIYKAEENKLEACEAYTNAINAGDITLTKEADDYCNSKKKKKTKERAINITL